MQLFDVVSRLLIPIIALIVSGMSFFMTNRMNKKVNRKDYEIAENLKFELFEFVAALRSIQAKIAFSPCLLSKVIFDDEIVVLKKINLSPSFLAFLTSLKAEKRHKIEMNLLMVIMEHDNIENNSLYKLCENLLDALAQQDEMEKILNFEMLDLIKQICCMDSIYSGYGRAAEKVEQKKHNEFSDFLKYLIDKKIDDSDVLLFMGVASDDKQLVEAALKNGANTKCTDKEIILKYSKEYEDFKKTLS